MGQAARHDCCLQIERQRRSKWCARAFRFGPNDTCFLCVFSVCVCVSETGGTPRSCSAHDGGGDGAQSGGGMGSSSPPVVAYCTCSDITSKGGRGSSHAQAPHALLSAPTTIHIRVYSCSACVLEHEACAAILSHLFTREPTHTLTHTHTSSPETYLSPPWLPDLMCHMALHPHQHHFKDQRNNGRGTNKSSDSWNGHVQRDISKDVQWEWHDTCLFDMMRLK